MENEFNLGEQPEVCEHALESIVKCEEESALASQQEGSPYGKFSSPEELYKAYNNLQAEFTRKCQKLSEIQKQIPDKEGLETSFTDDTQQPAPAFEKEDWRAQVASFLTENEQAKGFSREISNEILKDPNLQKSPSMLEIAWSRVLAKNYKSPDEIAHDSVFMENYVLKNDDLRKQVLGSYLNELNKQKAPPVIGSGIKGGMSLLTKSNKPTNLSDAKVLAEKLFKN